MLGPMRLTILAAHVVRHRKGAVDRKQEHVNFPEGPNLSGRRPEARVPEVRDANPARLKDVDGVEDEGMVLVPVHLGKDAILRFPNFSSIALGFPSFVTPKKISDLPT